MTVESLYREFLSSEGISIDSRKEVKGTVFFAIHGERFDGNTFVEEALNKGCRLAVTRRSDLLQDPRVVHADSPLELMQQMARHHRRVKSPFVLAITGSNGKTTTKELTKGVLSSKYRVLATRGNLNNHIGMPLTLLSLTDEDMAVIEMGANHPGEIRNLAGIAEPGAGLITNVGRAHLEGFGTLEGVLQAKGELYEYLASHEGKAFVDASDPVLMKKALESGVEQLVIGRDADLPVECRIINQTPYLEVEVRMGDEQFRVTTHLVGRYNLQNILYAASAGHYFGVPADAVRDALAAYRPENYRSQYLAGKSNRVILDSYNANPSSMRQAIRGLLEYASSPIMLILGDMAEVGDASEEEHRQLLEWIRTLPVERVILVGPVFSKVHEPSSGIPVFSEISEAESYLASGKPEGYHILVKGSRIMEMEKLTPLLT
ncbi:MAG: UDP-N-acetylmuramoyl-tripeptide--D-alanyl-D-alanine ligase [Bacteroidota bacterium]